MKTMFRAAIGALALLASPAFAQTATPADPALWVVKDADTTIYLFGTIHVLKPGMQWFDGGVKKAFDSSDTLMLEMVKPDDDVMRGLAFRRGVDPNGSLAEQLPADRRKAYDAAVVSLGFPKDQFDQMRPWLAATTLSILPVMKLGYDAANGPETVLTKAANDAHKPIQGFETPEQQIGFLADLSQPAQVAFLEATVEEMPDIPASIERMVTNWSHGDPDALAKDLNDDLKASPEVAQSLLFNRNARWADWIVERMKTPGTVFIAVGAGHLAGQQSVLDDLAKKGLAVERVKY